jgi:CBS domain-containing protein
MAVTTRPLAPIACDLTSRDVVTISQDMPLRTVVELFFQRHIGDTAVVDAGGRCIGMLPATDLLRWALAEERGAAEDVPPRARPYQVKRRLQTGGDAVIDGQSNGSCPMPDIRPMTGGRHMVVCQLREGGVRDWQEVSGGGARRRGAALHDPRFHVRRGGASVRPGAGRARCPRPTLNCSRRAAQATGDRATR